MELTIGSLFLSLLFLRALSLPLAAHSGDTRPTGARPGKRHTSTDVQRWRWWSARGHLSDTESRPPRPALTPVTVRLRGVLVSTRIPDIHLTPVTNHSCHWSRALCPMLRYGLRDSWQEGSNVEGWDGVNEILRDRVAEETEGRRKATPKTHELELNSVTLSKQQRGPDAAAPGAWRDK
ncbi:hypothetical protein E2C01_016493 [Portunus trituberculatus]|uniref:Uncharacterized protein n=1 Tax=Portunus trituberculatus TaxID=210409 RepID=A0A5B7DQW6_PORTR|nr:hypothetical protein [Portunus trituberculatus]